MPIQLIGKKVGMTLLFTEDGISTPVTIIEIRPNRITQIKNMETDGYQAIQVTTGFRRKNRVNKASAGHFAKAAVEAGRGLWEFRVRNNDELSKRNIKAGDNLTVSEFRSISKVDVTGQSKGKGFQGVVKRYNFSMQNATHGNALSHRAHGSTGQCQTPGRVWKGKKMAGHMGSTQVTVQSLKLMRIDEKRDFILVKGAVPGAMNSNLIIKPATKTRPVLQKVNV